VIEATKRVKSYDAHLVFEMKGEAFASNILPSRNYVEAHDDIAMVKKRAVCLAAWVMFAFRGVALGAGSSGFPSGATLGAQPDLTVGLNPPEGPGYVVASRCGAPGTPLITLFLRVTNAGSLTSPAITDQTAVTATDAADPSWTAGSSLTALSTGQTVGMTVVLPARAGAGGPVDFDIVVNGRPWFDETSFVNNRMKITVEMPEKFCQTEPASQSR
jgi:hypothetical protein